ncbi:hypothetical protein LXT21_34050 [Myxococcus sp. K38C18041901]|uniref:hypothetical protein n=1 Tax=Myxococcus guangdongensis TaxID=2906760 RepID=UPI0020A828F7|nr:hypothetical protein [Myxococcus guangdongensis]MCP3063810.1 hypothetical protein [Myxococcus guangdongensis]
MSLKTSRLWSWSLVVGLGLVGCEAAPPPGMESEATLGESASAVVIPPITSFDWPPFANVTDVSLGSGHRTVAVGREQPFTLSTDYFVGPDACIGCNNQLVFGVPGGTGACAYDGVGPVQSHADIKLIAPKEPGVHPVHGNYTRAPDCAAALASVGSGPAFGLIGVYVDPWDWSWGTISNLRLNGNSSHKINVFPGARVNITTDYKLDPAGGGCPSCWSQLVFGIDQGSKTCIYNGIGPTSATNTTFSLIAPTQPGLYPVWAAPQWAFTCDQALSWSNGGTPVAFIEVK